MSGFDLFALLFGTKPVLINVLDIGASENPMEEAAYEKLIKQGRARVVGFEPNQEACAVLNEKYGSSHRFYPYFIGNGKQATFYETNWNLTCSLFKPNKPLLEKFNSLHEVMTLKAEYWVQTMKLDDIEDLGDIDFVKIDIQGGELEAFQSGRKVLSNALLIQTEVEFVEFYEGQPLFAEVDQELRAQGFQFHTFNGFGGRTFKPLLVNGDPSMGFKQLLWSDAIYVRDWMRFDLLSTEKLKKLAFLLHEIVESPDLCHVALSEIDSRERTSLTKDYIAGLTEAN